MDTDIQSTEKRRLPDLHEPWRSPHEQFIKSQLNLDTWELDYSVLSFYPRDQIAHKYSLSGVWNRQEMLEKLRPHLLRSNQTYVEEETETNFTLSSLVFRLPEGPIVILDGADLEVFAASPDLARGVGDQLRTEFRRPPTAPQPHFYILKRTRGGGIQSNYVKLTERDALDDQLLSLYYGSGIAEWQGRLLKGIGERHCGITILQGPPGTGKTTYLRHLMTQHGANLRCYFIPSSNFNVLKDSEFVGYWSDERSNNRDKKLVVILEDAEAILATRSGDNRAEISNLLNITDGLMGDFLRLHLVCTMNGDFDDLDPAILRPGRLVARRHFGRIPRARALELVQYLEKPAPVRVLEEYTLAELFEDPRETEAEDTGVPQKRVVGFAAPAAP